MGEYRNILDIEVSDPLWLPAIERAFWARVDRSRGDGCWHWTGMLHNGNQPALMHPLTRRRVRSRRVSLVIAGRHPGEKVARATCGNRYCVNPDHIEIVDMQVVRAIGGKNTDSVGEKNGNAKLTAKKVHKIREHIKGGETNIDIALDYGVHHATISAIRLGRTWNDSETGSIQVDPKNEEHDG